MSAPFDPREEILETNLRALFARAYVPVAIRPGFAEEVRRAAGAMLDRAPRTHPAWGRAWLAAAASFLLAWIAVAAFQRTDVARDRILARGDVAMRASGGPWRALDGKDAAGVVRLELAQRRVVLAIPAGRTAALTCGEGGVALEGPLHASVVSDGLRTDIDVSGGELCVRGFHGRLRGAFGSFECAGADLDLAGSGADCARAMLSAGRARFEAPSGGSSDLAEGELFETCPEPGRGMPAVIGASLERESGETASARTPLPAPADSTAPAPGAPALLSGNVRGADGQPVTSFQVILLREVELPDAAEPSSQTFEDPAGRFAWSEPGRGKFSVYVQAREHALWTREHVALGGAPVELDVELERGAGLSGRVVDARTGAALSGAVVVSEADVPGKLLPFSVREVPENPAALAVADGEGRFQFEHLAPRPTVLRAVHHGFGAGWSSVLVPGSAAGEARVELLPGGVLAGRVELEDGSPWPEVAVIAMPQRVLVDLPRLSFGVSITDAGGAYRIEDLPAGEYVAVRVEPTLPDGSVPGRPAGTPPRTEVRQVSIPGGAEQRLDFLAPPRGSRLSGRVWRADGSPMSAATVSILPRDARSSTQGVPESWRSQLCGADGSYEFTDVLPGLYDVFFGVRSPMDIVRVTAVEVAPASNTSCDLHAPAGELSGTVRRAEDQAPVEFAAIVLERESGVQEPEFVAKVFSDETGAWRAPYLTAGTYRVRVYAGHGLAFDGKDGVSVSEGAPAARLDFALSPGSTMLLQVRDESGAPVANLEVRLFDSRERAFQPAELLRTDEEGRCRVEGLSAGRTRVQVVRPGATGAAGIETTVVAAPPAELTVELTWPAGK